MTPASLAIDSKLVDTRDRGSGRGAADSKATSSQQAFDGILSGLTDDATAAVAVSGSPTATPAASPTVLAPKIVTLDIKADNRDRAFGRRRSECRDHSSRWQDHRARRGTRFNEVQQSVSAPG